MDEGAFVPMRRRNRRNNSIDVSTSRSEDVSMDTSAPQVSLERGLGRLMSVKNLRRNASSENLKGMSAGDTSKPPKKHALQYGFSIKAREYIAVGFYDQAIALCQKASDVVGWSVALILSGDPEKAVDILEAFIIAACLVTYQETNKGIGGVKFDYRQILSSIVATPGSQATIDIMQSLPPPTEQLYHETILEVCESSSNWEELHQWYLTAILLHPNFSAPTNPWLKQFFGLFVPRTTTARSLHNNSSEKRALPPSKKGVVLSREEVENILISQCSEIEIHQVNAIVSWRLCRLRSSLRSCTELLKMDPQDIQIRFIRCVCALQLGERHTVGEDAKCLMQSASMLVSTVGCALATFGIPLASARPAVEQFQSTEVEQSYVYCLCEWTHSLTLLQLGQFDAAKRIAEHTLPFVPRRTNLVGSLMDIITSCCIALEDSASLLRLPKDLLGPFQQLHLALVSRFGGGYANDSINKIAIASPVGELLNPLNVNSYSDARQMVAIHCTTARSLFSFGHLREAWVEVCTAVGCAEELIGSTVFALSDCSPHRVYYLGCTIGMTLLDRLIEEDEESSKTISAEELEQKRAVDDKLGDSIIATCRVWARMVRDFHPNQVLGHAAITQVSIASHDLDSLERAVTIADRFPDQVITQNAVSYALYSKHLIPDAVAHAQKTLQKFPHVTEVQSMMYAVSGKGGTYTFLYRGLLPFSYGPGDERTTTWRLWVAFFVTLLNFVILVGMFVCNLSDWISFPSSLSETVHRVQVTYMQPFFVAGFLFVYSMVATFFQPTLVSVLLADLHVRNTRLNRFLYSSRCIPWVNVANAIQISVAGNNFGFDSVWYTVLLFTTLALLQFPYSSRTFFLSSMDEPHMALPFWITLVAADFTTFLALTPLLLFAAAVEPLMCIAFHFVVPPLPPKYDTGDILSRLLTHYRAQQGGAMGRFALNSGSTFPHIRLMKFMFRMTHSEMDTFYTAVQQQEEDDKRVFPLIEVLDEIPQEVLSKPAKSLSKPMDVATQQMIVSQRERTDAMEKSVQMTAKAGEGNLHGIMDDVAVDELEDDLDQIRLSPDHATHSSFGAEIMDALNAEFAKLSDQNTQLLQAAGASQAAKGAASKEGTRLGDVGLYRENKQNTQMLTTGPMMRQKDPAKRRLSHNPELSGSVAKDTSDHPAVEAPSLLSTMKRVQSTVRPGSPRGGEMLQSISSQGALLKAGMNRKQSLFRRAEPEFTIDDDDETSSVATTAKSSGSRKLAAIRRASFGATVEGDSDISSDSSDDNASHQQPPAAARKAGSNEPTSTSSNNAKGTSDPAQDVAGHGNFLLSGVAVVGSLSEFENDSETASRNTSAASTFGKQNSSPQRTSVDAGAAVKRTRSAVTFIAGGPATPKEEDAVVVSPEVHAAAPQRVVISPARSQSPSSGHGTPPPRISPEGSTVSKLSRSPSSVEPPASTTPSAVMSAYSAQLRRKQSALLQQRQDLMEAVTAVAAVRAQSSDHSEGEGSNSGAQRLLRRASSAQRDAEHRSSTTEPQPTTLQRRQSVTRVPATLQGAKQNQEFDTDVQARPASNPPTTGNDSQSKRVTSAPGSRQELHALDTEDDQKPINGTHKVKKILEDLRIMRASAQEGLSSGSAAADPAVQLMIRQQLGVAKMKFVKELLKIGSRVSVDNFELKKQISGLFVELVQEGDINRPGNLDVVTALLNTITSVDFAQVISSQRLVELAMERGQGKTLHALLMHKPVLSQLTGSQAVSLLEHCRSSHERRCALFTTLLDVATRCKSFHSGAASLPAEWQKTFESVVSLQQSLPNEDRTDLPQMLDVALNHPVIRLDPEVEGADKQTVFSRACREGDLVTVRHCLQRNKIKNVNRVQSDNTNALQQASARNHPDIVRCLLDVPNISHSVLHVFPGKGTVLDIAKSLKRDPAIVEMLATYVSTINPSQSDVPALSASPSSPQRPSRKTFTETRDMSTQVRTLLLPLTMLLDERRNDPPESELSRLSEAECNSKEMLAPKIEKLTPPPGVRYDFSKEARELILAVLENIVDGGDDKRGNVPLLKAMIRTFSQSLDFSAAQLVQREWFQRCLSRGATQCFDILTEMDGVSDAIRPRAETVMHSIIRAILKSNTRRITACRSFVKAAPILFAESGSQDVKVDWQRLMELVCDRASLLPGEASADRVLLLRELQDEPRLPTIDFETDQRSKDGHTIFSRACAQDDDELVRVLIDRGLIKNINRHHSDGNTALTRAIMEGSTKVPLLLLTSKALKGVIDVSSATGQGTPLFVAKRFKAPSAVVEALKAAGAER